MTQEDPTEWYSLYGSDQKFKRYFDSSTTAHPAKMSKLLCDKRFKHLEELGLLYKGDTICDFMSGIGTTGTMATLNGYRFVGIELEQHFVDMQNKNKDMVAKQIQRQPDWQIIQGDARSLSKILKEKGAGIISPPYGLGEGTGHSGNTTNKLLQEKRIHSS